MPELPEVETVKRELEKAVLGKTITGVIVNNTKVIKEPSLKKFVRSLKQAKIKNIIRRGKLLLLELSSGKALSVHLKMTGQLVYPGDAKKSRVSFKFSNSKLLDFNDSRIFGELRLLDDWRALKFVRELGPEPFDLNFDQFMRMLKSKRTKIKPLLLDQSFIAGIGNLYAAEVLFRAKIHPVRQAVSLSSSEAKLLLKEIKQVLREAIRCKGSSIDQYVQLTGRPGSYVEHHKVYDRKGEPCFICKTPIKRIPLGGRGTYFCPKCQK